MIILAIESSCDETAVALVRDGREVLTDQVFSQADLHAIYGGVVPEIASRSHVEVISQLADRALAVTGLTRGDIDAVAVTCAPGLIGALLVVALSQLDRITRIAQVDEVDTLHYATVFNIHARYYTLRKHWFPFLWPYRLTCCPAGQS